MIGALVLLVARARRGFVSGLAAALAAKVAILFLSRWNQPQTAARIA